jgi:hypothetical protein
MRPLGLTDEVLSPHHDMILLRLLIKLFAMAHPMGAKNEKTPMGIGWCFFYAR